MHVIISARLSWHDRQTPHCSGFTGRFALCSHWTLTTGSWWFSTWCSHYEEASTPAKLLTAREREEPVAWAWPSSHKCHSHSHLIGPCKSHVNNNSMEQHQPQVQKVSQLSLVNNTESHHKHCTQACTLWHGSQDQNMHAHQLGTARDWGTIPTTYQHKTEVWIINASLARIYRGYAIS